MELVSSASAKKTNPRTLKVMSCMLYEFSTGNKCSIFSDGTTFYNRRDGGALPLRAHKAREQMNNLIGWKL